MYYYYYYYYVISTNSSQTYTLHVTGHRVVQDEYAIRLSENGIWELEGRVNDVRKTETRQIIIAMLEEAGDEGLRATDIITSSRRKENVVRLQLRRMLAAGEIIQPNVRGKYFSKNNLKAELLQKIKDNPHLSHYSCLLDNL